MKTLEKLFHKKRKTIIGLMSGTSADGIDAALVEIDGSGTSTKIRLQAFQTFPYPRGFREFLLKNSHAETARLDDVTRLDMLIAVFFADAAKSVARKARVPLNTIDCIGSHGQTIHHLPSPRKMFGKSIRSTLQIGNPSAIAKRTGIVTIGDFRMGDVASGGSGAPLVPLFDYLTLRSRTKSRVALNIGGIANITILPRNCSLGDVAAFDTGPGNMVVDALARKFFHRSFDNNGRIAAHGKLNSKLLYWMSRHPYLQLKPPKSTGRELFGREFLDEFLHRGRGVDPADLVATATEFTALSIYKGWRTFVARQSPPDELIVSGGGIHNRYLMNALHRYFSGVAVHTADALAIPSDAKEAMCFALLANETLASHAGNVPRATGAARPAILGVIALP
jgi:anhydro-N-acetylmuramic acid kinase